MLKLVRRLSLVVLSAVLALLGAPAEAQIFIANGQVVVANGVPVLAGSSSGPTGLQTAGFPRTAVLFYTPFSELYSGTVTGCAQTMATIAAQTNLMIVPWYYGVEQTYGSYATLMSGWKTAATANGLTQYTVLYSAGMGFYNTGTTTPWLSAAVNAASMWLYTAAAGSGTTDLVSYYGNGSSPQSWLNFGSTNAQTIVAGTIQGKTNVLLGYSVWDAYAQYYTDSLMSGLAVSKYGETAVMGANTYLNGFFIDNNIPWGPVASATYNGLGTTPVAPSNTIAHYIQVGDASLAAAFRTYIALSGQTHSILVSNSGYATGYLGGNFTSNDPTYNNVWDAILEEGTIGSTSGVEYLYNSPVAHWMSGMIAAESSLNSNGVQLFQQVGKPGGVAFSSSSQASWTTGAGGDWQAARFGIAAAMMRNSYYILNPGGESSYNSVGLSDEMLQGGSYAWLSNGTQRLDPPQSGPATQVTLTGTGNVSSVWVRRFPNGWDIWNPRGNGAVTITNVPTTLHRLTNRGSSYGDPSVNSGAQVTSSVTLQDADGLFLIGTGALFQPLGLRGPGYFSGQDAANGSGAGLARAA